MSIDERVEKRGPGRPKTNRDEERATRPERVPMSEQGGTLTLIGKNPDFEYYWAVDNSENGHNVYKFQLAGWELSTTENDPGIKIGADFVYQTQNVGSVYRVPASKTGGYLYLMRIRKEWYDEDAQRAQKKITDRENGIFSAEKGEGQYGNSGYYTE